MIFAALLPAPFRSKARSRRQGGLRRGDTERLIAKLNEALPIPARATPELQASLLGQTGGAVPAQCAITWIYYMGDEGGIVCKLDLGANAGKEAFTSITHLRFDPRLPLAREIAAYQKHRIKRLRRQPS